MPIMDGIEFTTLMKKHFAEIKLDDRNQPVVVGVTGHVGEHFRREGLQAGMDEIYTKPMYEKLLKEILAKYLK